MSTSESRLPIYQKTSTSVEMWVPQLNLYLAEKHALLSNQWLSDAIIHAAQVLIKKQFVIQGLQSPQCGRKLSFKVLPLSKTYMQILHIDGNHWITVTNCNMATCKPCNNRVLIFDSMLPKKVSLEVKQQVCSFARPTSESFRFDVMNIMSQPNLYDCGIFSIANAIEIACGRNPAKCVWDLVKARHHLIQCLEEGRIDRFPKIKERRVPFWGAIKTSEEENIYCTCRMPYDNVTDMIQCCLCNKWFHCACVDICDLDDYCKKDWFCMKCII